MTAERGANGCFGHKHRNNYGQIRRCSTHHEAWTFTGTGPGYPGETCTRCGAKATHETIGRSGRRTTWVSA